MTTCKHGHKQLGPVRSRLLSWGVNFMAWVIAPQHRFVVFSPCAVSYYENLMSAGGYDVESLGVADNSPNYRLPEQGGQYL